MTEELAAPTKFDVAVAEMLDMPQIECPVDHHFVPGFYIRVFRAPKGACIISKIHKTLHNFCISKGVASVYDEEKGWQTYAAPYQGFTKPGTQRALIVHEDLVWSTAHAIQEEEIDRPDLIEDRIIENKNNPLLNDQQQAALNAIKEFHSQDPMKKLELQEAT